jgi:hypothetical protein
VAFWICAARAGEMRFAGLVVAMASGLLARVAVATSEVVVSSATPARGGSAMHRAQRMLGMGRVR